MLTFLCISGFNVVNFVQLNKPKKYIHLKKKLMFLLLCFKGCFNMELNILAFMNIYYVYFKVSFDLLMIVFWEAFKFLLKGFNVCFFVCFQMVFGKPSTGFVGPSCLKVVMHTMDQDIKRRSQGEGQLEQ